MERIKNLLNRLGQWNLFKVIATRIRVKLFVAFLIVILLAIAIAVTALISYNQTLVTAEDLVEVDVRLAELSLETKSAMLEARRSEKDYLLRFKELGFEEARAEYVTRVQQQVALIRQNAVEMQRLERLEEHEAEAVLAESIEQFIGEYETTFLKTVDLIEQRGFKDDGLEGQFRDDIHAVEDVVTKLGLDRLEADMLTLRRHEKDYFLRGEEQYITSLHERVVTFKDDIAATDSLSPVQKEELVVLVDNYEALFDQVVQLDTTVAANIQTYRDAVDQVEPLVDQLRDAALIEQAAAKADLEQVAQTGSQTIIGISVAVLVLGIGLSLWLARNITRQIDTITDTFANVAEGDLISRTSIVSSDELGQMAIGLNNLLDRLLALIQTTELERATIQSSIQKLLEEISGVAEGDLTLEAEVTAEATGAIADSFNFMIGQLREIISNVQDATVRVSTSANELSSTAEFLSRGSEAQATQIVDTTAAIDEMSVSIQAVSENASRSAEVASWALSNAQQGAQVVQETITSMNRIREQVQETSKRIVRLSESSKEIGDIVQLISDIADRTSILALNASIQAAMAGDAGKGFAVVAEEVESLAERATQATRQITSIVKTIQSETNETAAAMEESQREVVEGSQLADQAGQALVEIEIVSNELSDLIQTISLAARQQARGSEIVAYSMNEIAEVTQQTAAGTKLSAESMQNLSGLADQLRTSVSTFKLPSSNGYINKNNQPE